MRPDDGDILHLLKMELASLENLGKNAVGGGRWKPTVLFLDSPICLKTKPPEQSHACQKCKLLQLVPPDRQKEDYPCHHIPLNATGETLEGLYRRGTEEEREQALRSWLHEMIGRIERFEFSGNQDRRSQRMRRTEDVLREKDGEFHLLADSIPELCGMAYSNGHIFWYNQRFYEYTGTTPGNVEGWGWQTLIEPQALPSVLQRWKLSLEKGQPFEMEFCLRGADGVFRWFLTRIRPLRNSEGQILRWFGIATNIHQQREFRQSLLDVREDLENRVKERTAELNVANESLSQLSAQLLQMQDEERRRLARELHDSVGQALAGIAMNIAVVRSSLSDSEASRAAGEIASLVAQATSEIRTISHLLHPPLLDEVGLASAVRWYVEGFSQRSGIAVDLDVAQGFGRLHKDIEIAIFRIVQECLTNVHRHSGSHIAHVKMGREGGYVRVSIEDSGKGISLEKQAALQSMGQMGVGFRGMRERITQLHGTLEVQSSDSGTLVSFTIPEQSPPGTRSSEDAA